MIDIIRNRLADYPPTQHEYALKEVLQEIALFALWRADFFQVALFQGGTSLRILHALPRFSEHLDFLLRRPDPEFRWEPYLEEMTAVFREFGLALKARSRESMDSAIRQAVLKEDSIASQLDLQFATSGPDRSIRIKLEIDTRPPSLSGEATTFLDFPSDFEVRHQDLSSNFALKIHALLCRGYLKGRDWFDFSWYVSRSVRPNLAHLQAALVQAGPWKGDNTLAVNDDWLKDELENKIDSINWPAAAQDVRRFLRPAEESSLKLWGVPFFKAKLDKLVVSAE
jgi:predicted nucleotidyltransferase component of viral defense system